MGAPSGATPMISAISDSIFAAAAPSKKSRTMARPITDPAAAPSDCTIRQPISQPIVGATAQPTLPTMNSTMPPTSGQRRPKRSLSGP